MAHQQQSGLFAEFERLGATINTEAQCAAFTRMVVATRA